MWDSIVPGLHSWFIRKRAPIFRNQVVGKALDRLQLDTRFTINRLELIHKIQKKNTEEANSGLEVTSVLKTDGIYHLKGKQKRKGKFKLAPGYKQFYREPTI